MQLWLRILFGILVAIIIGVAFFSVLKPPLSFGILLGVMVATIGAAAYFVTKSKQIAMVILSAGAALILGTMVMIILAVSLMQ